MLFLGLPWSHTLGTMYFCSRPSGHAANSIRAWEGLFVRAGNGSRRGAGRIHCFWSWEWLPWETSHHTEGLWWFGCFPCLLHWAVTALDWKKRVFLLWTHPIARRIWVHGESCLGWGEWELQPLRGSFFQASRIHLTEKGTCLQQ